ncbi:hypothetical protein IPdc08_01891 [archaeon]|nr:hypothetical protein IPdc08_01891 [archaeon]
MSFIGIFGKMKGAVLNVIKEELENSNISENEAINEFKKGKLFEDYVKSKFSKRYFSVEYQTPSYEDNQTGFINASNRPDFTLKYMPKGIYFSVECKYRSNLYKGKYNWTKKKQMDRYKQFMEEEGHPVFIVMGLGGEPNNPEKMYCVPLKDIKYVGLYPSFLDPYERDLDKFFFLDPIKIMLR